MTKVILLNAPPRAGKDTAARAIISELRAAARAAGEEPTASYSDIVGFSHELKELTHRAHGLDLPHDHFEKVKGQPNMAFRGHTPREAYIIFSEEVMKRAYGKDVFGRLLLARLGRMKMLGDDRVIVVPDSGFVDEALVLTERFGAENVLLLKIDASRRGCTYEGDSRSFIELPGVETVWVDNDRAGTIGRAVFQKLVSQVATAWLARAAAKAAPASLAEALG